MKNVFLKKKSIQKSLIISSILAVVITLIASLIGYFLLVHNQAVNELLKFNVTNDDDISEILSTLQRSVLILIFNTIIISIILMKITGKKIIQPIMKINEATKKVASGDFNVQLESNREDEIGELTSNFNQMVIELKSIECLRKEFVDNVSHEIKTPINSIQGFTKLIMDENVSLDDRREYANIILEESNRLLNVSTNILELSKLQNQNRLTSVEQIDVEDSIRKAIRLLELKWKVKKIQFNLNFSEKYFYGNEDLVFQVWTNLIDNAIKFSNDGGNIDITTEKKENFIEITIRDYGIGIDKKEVNKIFTRFYQIDKSHSEQGSGLGLSIVKRIIELSNGEIEVLSEKKNGTSMIVRFPLEKQNNKFIIN